jgi:hypothetical protein
VPHHDTFLHSSSRGNTKREFPKICVPLEYCTTDDVQTRTSKTASFATINFGERRCVTEQKTGNGVCSQVTRLILQRIIVTIVTQTKCTALLPDILYCNMLLVTPTCTCLEPIYGSSSGAHLSPITSAIHSWYTLKFQLK